MGGLLRLLLLGIGTSIAVRAAKAFFEGYFEAEPTVSRVRGVRPRRPPFDARDVEDAEFEDLPEHGPLWSRE
jgi:hypothetical protein